MTSYPDSPTGATAPSLEQLMAWPAAWWSFWWALQLECLSELSEPRFELAPWMRWYNGTEQLA